MRRVLLTSAALLAVLAGVVVATTALTGSGDDGAYRVRAEFRNAFAVVDGLDVKIAGVRVGQVESRHVTPEKTAAVVLRIDRAGFEDFRTDASCTIRPQTLIGERFVECTPTVPKSAGQAAAPALPVIPEGRPGAGQRRLPLSRTGRPVDLDLVNNTLNLPTRQRLSLILNELGTGLAGRGSDLNAAIRAADPALRETDEVLRILAGQNRELARLADDGAKVLEPLARDRERVADLIVQADATARATGERKAELEASLQRLPTFLGELRPTLQRLGALGEQLTPALQDLGAAAPGTTKLVTALGPFAEASTPAITRLGKASIVGRQALTGSRGLVADLGRLGTRGAPLSRDLRELLESVRSTGGFERLMDFLYYTVGATNGFDQYGHFLRTLVVVNLCSNYATGRDASCTANFQDGAAKLPGATAASTAGTTARAAAAPQLLDYLMGND